MTTKEKIKDIGLRINRLIEKFDKFDQGDRIVVSENSERECSELFEKIYYLNPEETKIFKIVISKSFPEFAFDWVHPKIIHVYKKLDIEKTAEQVCEELEPIILARKV